MMTYTLAYLDLSLIEHVVQYDIHGLVFGSTALLNHINDQHPYMNFTMETLTDMYTSTQITSNGKQALSPPFVDAPRT